MSDYVAIAAYYRMTAFIYLENAKRLEASYRSDEESVSHNKMAFPYYVLMQHAFELLLKTALLKRGVSPAKLKHHELRHNLTRLLDEVVSKGVPVSPLAKQVVEVLSEQHSNHTLRYDVLFEGSEPVYTPEPKDIYTTFDELVMAGRIATFGM